MTYDAMASGDEVAYCPMGFGYSNHARQGFRAHPLRFTSPPGHDATRPGVGTLGGAGIAVSAHGRHPEAAARYAAYVASPEVQRTTYVDAGGQPGHRSAWLDERANGVTGGYFRDTLRALDRSYLRPRYDGFLDLQDAAGEIVHAYLVDGGSPDEVLDRLDDRYRESSGGA
jgi:multiple sugar transport system substrate-binding protein